MLYIDTYELLKKRVSHEDSRIDLGNIIIENFTFQSKNFNILPGEEKYICLKHNHIVNNIYGFENKLGIGNEFLDIHDSQIQDNTEFKYLIFKPKDTIKSSGTILLLHGFNEKYWHKYLPWAKRIVELTGKTCILFPIAFHMNRAPQTWSEKHLMHEASLIRKQHFPNVISSSLSNVAISTRIHAKPQRFLWSGLQTYYDIIDFIELIKSEKHPIIESTASINIFAYSIGAFLAQILMMTNHNNYFSTSKLVMFCGGAVFNRISPVSKFILDSEANVNLYSFIVEHLDSHLKKDERLAHYLSQNHPEGIIFRTMLNYSVMSDLREERFMSMRDRIMAVVLKKDTVMAPYEVINTLQGRYRDIPIRVDTLDFPYSYKHEDPFPIVENIKQEVNDSFEETFANISRFLK